MFEILVGTTPTANQQVFGIAKGTQATNTPLFTVDEDGDGDFAGGLTLGTALPIAQTALIAGTNITLSTNTLNVDDAFIINSGSDVMAGTLTADGLTLGANENITLGAQTLDHDGTTFVFNDDVSVSDEAYSASNWNASVEVPTKNAVRDEFETRTIRIYRHYNVNQAIVNGAHTTGDAGINLVPVPWVTFDASTDETVIYPAITLPINFSSGSLKAHLIYKMDTATADSIGLEVAIMAVADGQDPEAESFDTFNDITGGTTIPGTAELEDTIDFTLSNDDSAVAGERIYPKILRDVSDGDNATGDLKLTGFNISYNITLTN